MTIRNFCTMWSAIALLSGCWLLSAKTSLAQDPAFFDRILNDRDCRQCYFVSLEVSSLQYSGKVIIENDELFSFIRDTKGLNGKEYSEFMKDLLMSGKSLMLDSAIPGAEGLSLNIKGVTKNQFRLLKSSDELEKTLAKGCIATVSRYFLDKSIDSMNGVSLQDCHAYIKDQKKGKLMSSIPLGAGEDATLIARLFEWQIPARIDDLSGRIVISK
ncbi:MAG: hypothetical protein ABL999_19675 [Pyrinomonadaceae bacterium]